MSNLVAKLIGIVLNVMLALTIMDIVNPPKWIRVTMAVILLLVTGIRAITADDD